MKGSIQVGVIGCGGMATGVHLPNLAKVPALRLRATCDIRADAAESAAKKYGADYSTTDHRRILDDDSIDLCIVATRHDSHAHLTLEIVEAGKHLLVEKPMCMTPAETDQILMAVEQADIVYTVGHNRRYAPLAVKAARALDGRSKPWIVNYRMVDRVWRDHWALSPHEGGGRIISEAGHVFDFLAWLLDSDPVRIYAQGGQFTHPELADTQDNAVMTVSFENGSLASIVHGDIGHEGLAKERIEAFVGEAAFVLDDFRSLKTLGLSPDLDLTVEQDKGHLRELELLAEAIESGGRMPVDESAAARAMFCSFAALESIRSGSAVGLDNSAWRPIREAAEPHAGRPDFEPSEDTSY